MFDALVNGEDGGVPGACEASGVEDAVVVVEDILVAIGHGDDAVDEVWAWEVECGFGDGRGVEVEKGIILKSLGDINGEVWHFFGPGLLGLRRQKTTIWDRTRVVEGKWGGICDEILNFGGKGMVLGVSYWTVGQGVGYGIPARHDQKKTLRSVWAKRFFVGVGGGVCGYGVKPVSCSSSSKSTI